MSVPSTAKMGSDTSYYSHFILTSFPVLLSYINSAFVEKRAEGVSKVEHNYIWCLHTLLHEVSLELLRADMRP